jgi:hypothetical protein
VQNALDVLLHGKPEVWVEGCCGMGGGGLDKVGVLGRRVLDRGGWEGVQDTLGLDVLVHGEPEV